MVTPGSDSLRFFHMPLHINFPDQMHMWQQFARLCNAGRLAMWLPSWQVGSSMLKCPFKNNQRTHVRFLFFQPWCDYSSSQPLKMKKDVHRDSNSVDLKCRSNGKSRKKTTESPRSPPSPWHDISDGRCDAVVFPVGQRVLGKADVHANAQPDGTGNRCAPLEYDQRCYAEAEVSGIARQQDVQLSPLLAIVWEVGKVGGRGWTDATGLLAQASDQSGGEKAQPITPEWKQSVHAVSSEHIFC